MAIARNHDACETLGAENNSVNASLMEICQAMGSSLELPAVLDTILGLTLHEMRAQQGSILLFDENLDRLQMLAAIGLPEEMVRKGYIPRKGSIAEFVIANNQPLILNDSPTNSNYRPLDFKRRIISAMCVPLRVHGKVIGTINLNRTDPDQKNFVDRDLDTMIILAGQAAIFIENSRLHESCMQAERLAAIGQTVAGISHCIKNVLTGVRGGMSLIEMARDAEDWKLIHQGSDILRRNLDRLSSIVLDMLDYSKDRQPVTAPVDVWMLLDEVRSTIESTAHAKNINIEVSLEPEKQRIDADAQQIYRCLLNLAHNAIEATPEGGRVMLSAQLDSQPATLRRLARPDIAQAVVLRVKDTGGGISEDNRLTIFEPFFSTKGSKGTGLGLAVTRKIVREHGGLIELETVTPEPACFAIYLPATAVETTISQTSQNSESAG